MLPEDVAKEVRDRKSVLNTVDNVVTYLMSELSRYNDKHLSTLQDRESAKRIEHGPKNAVNAVVSEPEEKFKILCEQFESLTAALSRRGSPKGGGKGGDARGGNGGGGGGAAAASGQRPTLPRPDPNFSGCWHCGKQHKGGRRQCLAFKAYLKEHGGVLPADYQGAYEKHMADQGRKVSAIFAQADAAYISGEAPAAAAPGAPLPGQTVHAVLPHEEPSGSEHPETAWDGQFFALLDTHAPPQAKSFCHATRFQHLASADGDADDSPEDLVAALRELTPNVARGPKRSQRERKDSR